jgi:tRNA(Arg) A34 adenosine deaminase TadA
VNEHNQFIYRAIELSNQALEKGNHPFGAVLVHKDRIILESENTVTSENDLTRHAEMNLVSHACRQLSRETLAECTLYSSTEPCPMCAGAIYWTGIPRVVYGCSMEALGQIAGPGIHMGCRSVFDCCYQGTEVIGPIEEELACEPHMSCWPHPS